MWIENFNLTKHNLENFISKVRALDLSQDLTASIKPRKIVRTPEQNALYWAGALKDIETQLFVNGKNFSDKIWHDYFREQFLPEDDDPDLELLVKNADTYRKWVDLPNGSRRLSPEASTTKLTKKGFSQYLEQIYAFGSAEGVRFTEVRHGI